MRRREPRVEGVPGSPGSRAVHEGHRPGTEGYRRVVVALFAAGLATFALIYSTQAVLPELAREFSVSTASSTFTVSLTTAALGLTLLVAGPLSDLVGRTRLIHLSLTTSAVIAAACAVAPTWTTLLALRLLLGVALAGLPAVATAYLREELHASTHARAAGMYVGSTALGGMTGRLLSGGLAEALGWRWALAGTAALALACAAVVALLLPASRGFEPAQPGLRPLLRMTRRALCDPALLSLYAAGGCSAGALVAVFNTLSFRLTGSPFNLGLGTVSLVFVVYLLGTASSTVFGRAADRYGRRAVLPLGALIAVAGALLTLPDSLPLVVTGVAVMTAGFFGVHGVASGWVPARAHAGGVSTGQAASLYLFAYYLGSSVFGSLAGHAWTVAAWPGVVVLAVALFAVTGVLALVLRGTASLLPGPSPAARQTP